MRNPGSITCPIGLAAAKFSAVAEKKRAAGYIRLSVLTEDTYSPETQRNAILKRCKANGWDIENDDAILSEEDGEKISGGDFFVDLGFSGSKGIHRPAYQALLKELRNYDYVVVYKLDRLTRKMSELGEALDALKKSKTSLVGITDGIDTSTGIGQSVAELLGTIGAAEARNIRDRVISAQQTMLTQGKWRGGPPPYGYAIKKGKPGEGSTLVINPEQAKYIRQAVNWFIAGKSIPSICKELNGKGSRSVFGNPWSDPTLRRLLGSPYLAGYQVYDGQIFRDDKGNEVRPFPELISLEKYNLLQAKIKERYFYHPSRGGALLSGFIYCVYCGGRMVGASPTEHGGATYRCRAKYQLHKDCDGLSTKSGALEGYVSKVILELLSKKETRKVVLGMTKNLKARERKSGVDDPATKHEFLRSELQSLQSRKADGDFDYRGGEEDFKNSWNVLKNRLVEIEKIIKETAPTTSNPHLDKLLLEKDLLTMEQIWNEKMSVSERRDVAKALIRKVVILPLPSTWTNKEGYATERVVIEWQWKDNKDVTNYYPRNQVPKAGTREKQIAARKAAKKKAAAKPKKKVKP